MNNLKKYLILLELVSFKIIDLDIIKKKYRELAMRFHPDITGRDTNKEMAEINNAYEYLIRNINAANEELKNIWREKEAEFARIYRDAIIKDLSSATISQLRRSINLFNTISGYKDVEDLINKYTTQLNKLLKEEARKESIYKQAILDIRNATMKELEEAISLLKTIPNYKDSNNLILIYSNQIEKIREEIKKNESYYKQIQKIKNDSITDSELEKIIRFLNTYNVPGSEELLNHFYHRQNQFLSVEKRLENERNEKMYVALLSTLGKAKTIKDFKEIISKYTKIKNYKNVSSILLQCEASIQNIIEQEEYERKDKIYNEAIEYLKQPKDNAILQKAIDLLKTIRDFKEAEVLITKAVSLIFDNNEEARKSKIYDRCIIGLDSNDFNHLEALLKELNTVDNYKDIINLKEQYNQKIDKLKETIYQQASIDIKSASITELEKVITTLNSIIDYKDSKKLIEIYNKKIASIKLEEEEKKKANLEEVYLSGLTRDEEKITETLLKNKIKTLSRIENYKDSKKIIQSYKKYLNELAVERRKKQFKKYSLVFLKFYLPLLILIFIIFQVTTKTIIPTVNYNQGIKLFESGNYEEAIERFNKTNKNDNIDKYIIAAESGLILESGDYLSAITMLESIGAEIDVDYDESTTQLLALSYSSYSPKENGYSFIKWDLDDYELKIKNDNIKANIYLKAIWKINDYSVKFNSNGGTSYSNIDFNIEDDDIILPTPNKTGHTFMGWYNNSNFTGSKITSINKGSYGNINLYAKWEVNKYTINFEWNGHKILDDKIVEFGSYIVLENVEKEGFYFEGWSYEGESNNHFEYIYEHDITINAIFSEKLSYSVNDGNFVWQSYEEVIYYKIILNGNEYSLTTTNFSLDDSYKPGVYNIEIFGIRNGINLRTGNIIITKLTTPKNMRLKSGVIVVDKVNNAVGYRVEINGEIYEYNNEPEFYLPDSVYAENYKIKILALGDDVSTVNSDYNVEQIFSKFEEPNISFYNNTIFWSAKNHEKIYSYHLYINNEFFADLGNDLNYKIPEEYLKDKLRYCFQIKVVALDHKFDSDLSSVITKLETPIINETVEDIKTQKVISWEAIEGASLYKIILYGNKTKTTELEASSTNYKIEVPLVYNIIIKAIGNEVNIDSAQNEISLLVIEDEQEFIYFGYYPQTVVDDILLINKLDSLDQKNKNGNYEYEGYEYAKIIANPFDENYKFGNNEYIKKGAHYYFKLEPIKWKILKNQNNELTLITDTVLDQQVFLGHDRNRTANGKTVYPNSYEKSKIREWLNSSSFFLQTFQFERRYILGKAIGPTEFEEYPPYFMRDSVYLLNINEINLYLKEVEQRPAKPSDFALAKGVYQSAGFSPWWLRDNYIQSLNEVYYIDTDGVIYIDYVYEKLIGVRPSINIVIN